MKTTPSGKNTYVAISDNHAVRVRAYSKPKATLIAAMEFVKEIKDWKPEHGGIVDKGHSKIIRAYISEHSDLIWINGGAPIDG